MKICTCPFYYFTFRWAYRSFVIKLFYKVFERYFGSTKQTPWRKTLLGANAALKLCASEASAENKNVVWGRSPTEKFRKSTLRKIFAPKKRWKEMGVRGRSRREKSRVLKNVICGLVWNFLSRASEPSASRKKKTLKYIRKSRCKI